ncbi:YtcA family lipoprotein [Mesopusillimonas faecipullorum]|uniref:YtcA family lipoprotein n=1 Tax=Mesopusillimonas faecipullorum TaxID=2755040 RepID=UPI001D0283FF|nr:YtcA family lipoprotein [Mesopusillimonas faecipullorum]
MKTYRPRQLYLQSTLRYLGLALLLPLLSGCSGSPSIYIAGSYFPAWLLAAIAAIVLTLIVRLVLIRIGIDDNLPLRLLVYVCMALALTFTLLLVFFD